MISNQDLEQELSALDGVHFAAVSGDGYHYDLTLVSDVFLGQSKLARQRWVYAKLNERIQSGSLHAVNLHTWTLDEWEKRHG